MSSIATDDVTATQNNKLVDVFLHVYLNSANKSEITWLLKFLAVLHRYSHNI